MKYANKEDAEHLMSVLKQNYEVTEDAGKVRDTLACIYLCWDYPGRKVHLAMPGYVEKALRDFLHEHSRRKQYSPFPRAKRNMEKKHK